MVHHAEASRLNIERMKQIYQQLSCYRGLGLLATVPANPNNSGNSAGFMTGPMPGPSPDETQNNGAAQPGSGQFAVKRHNEDLIPGVSNKARRQTSN
ncbi:hypothetical protein DPEC_G00164170 [Dallia pectoralis]|uniref:Uncharacterized protein n=1 Tax=Dallia pectoralis TaxID=75939 RepID=A0ACC2GGS0_DALPE|nr:hypothetical protein DPEC_G00164170 [Dallia pectoralis]